MYCFFQIVVPKDYQLWYETMITEFPGRFARLFAGPMWSGQTKENQGYIYSEGMFCFYIFSLLASKGVRQMTSDLHELNTQCRLC